MIITAKIGLLKYPLHKYSWVAFFLVVKTAEQPKKLPGQ